MPLKKPHKEFIRFLLFWLMAGVPELPILFELFKDDDVAFKSLFVSLFACQLLSIVLLFFSVPRGQGWFHHRRVWPRVFAIFIFFLPVFGWLIVGVTRLFYMPTENPEEFFAEMDRDTIQPAEAAVALPTVLASHDERVKQELDFMPLTDILAGSDLELKRGAIDKLSKLGTPESIAILFAHRSDPQPEVRFYVTSALTHLKKDMHEELNAAKQRMQNDVSHPQNRLLLAKTYLRQAQTGILDDVTMAAFEQEALHHLKFLQNTAGPPTHTESGMLLISVYRLHKDWTSALEILDQVDKEVETTAEPAKTLDWIKTRIEILYCSGHYDQVRHELKRLRKLGPTGPEWDAVAFSWGAV